MGQTPGPNRLLLIERLVTVKIARTSHTSSDHLFQNLNRCPVGRPSAKVPAASLCPADCPQYPPWPVSWLAVQLHW